jgi:transcription termination/antitermination protein NusG
MTHASPDEPLDADAQQAAAEPAPLGGDVEAAAEAAEDRVSMADDATVAAESVTDDEDEDDGTPAELADPFSGSEDAAPVEMADGDEEEKPAGDRQWFILKVQSNREDSIRDTLLRRISMQGMERWFGEVIVPKEQVTEFKSGKKRVVWRKLYPGYILVNMILNDETWYLVRETGGIGDFTGSAGRPSPMLPQDVAKLLNKTEEKADEAPRLKIAFKKGDRVKINEGTFENFEGEVEAIDEANGRVTVMLSIFGRSTPVDIEYWQIETV